MQLLKQIALKVIEMIMPKKTDVANDITTIKNDYVSNASLTSRLNDLKSQHIPNEVKTIDDKIKKNASDILGFKSRLKQKEDAINENEIGLSFNRGFFYYLQKNHLVYECKSSSFKLLLLLIKYLHGNQFLVLV